MANDAPSLRSRILRQSWLLQSIQVRQAARRAFDLTRLGTGPLERFCSALILGALFFFPTLVLFWSIGLGAAVGGSLAAAALATVLATSVVLVLWSSDEELEHQRPLAKQKLDALREEEALQDEANRQQAEVRQQEAIAALDEPATDGPEPRARHAPVNLFAPSVVRNCPYCREEINAEALKCKHCGEILSERLRQNRRPRVQPWNAGVAAVLSFFWPGLGQIYKREVLGGIVWFFMVLVGYLICFIPGVFLHVMCIFHAASGGEDW